MLLRGLRSVWIGRFVPLGFLSLLGLLAFHLRTGGTPVAESHA